MDDLRKKFFLTLGVTIMVAGTLLGLFLYLFAGVIAPLSTEFRSVQEQIKIIEERSKDFKGRVAPALAREEADIIKIERSFFVYSQDTFTEFIKFLEAASKRNNLTGEITGLPSATSQTASMHVTGSFDDVIVFLREIENGPILLGIESVSFRGSGGKVSLVLQLRLPLPPKE